MNPLLNIELTHYEVLAMGVSAGGMLVLTEIVKSLKPDFPLTMIIVQHLHPHQDEYYIQYYNRHSKVRVKEAEDKETIARNRIYFAPPNYHLLVEDDYTFSLSVDEKVNFSRPAVDVLFDTASFVFGKKMIGLVLTGANSDGARGLKKIKDRQGLTIIQNPAEAEFPSMPQAALQIAEPHHIISVSQFVEWLKK